MLDYLDDCCRIEARQHLVAIRQRSVMQPDSFALHARQAIELQTTLCDFERANRNVHAEDVGELLVRQEFTQQLSFATAKVNHCVSARSPDHGQDGPQSLLMQRLPSSR